jgi:hypothetical protein
MIWEILSLLQKDLCEKYRGTISAELQKRIDDIVETTKSNKDDEIKILREIRNKHSFHIAHDDHYAMSFFSDEVPRWDYKIGVFETTMEGDIYYTMEDHILVGYLMREFNKNENEIFDILMSALIKYSRGLLELFNSIFAELLKDKIYIM